MHYLFSVFNFQLPNSSEGTSVPRCRTFGTMIDVRSLPFSLLSLALIPSHHIPTRVGKSQRVVEAIGISVVGLGVFKHSGHCLGFVSI